MRRVSKMVVALLMAVICMVSAVSPTSAATGTGVISGGSQHACFLRLTTYSASAKVQPIYQSQAEHLYGYTTTIGVNYSETKSVNVQGQVTATVGANVLAVAASIAATVGVAIEESFTVGTNVSYSVGPDKPSGRYRIEVVFPCNKVKFYCYRSDATGVTPIYNRTIASMPRANDAFHRLARYADVFNPTAV